MTIFPVSVLLHRCDKHIFVQFPTVDIIKKIISTSSVFGYQLSTASLNAVRE